MLVFSIVFAVTLDLVLGDPKNRYHPTAWIGILIGKLAPLARSDSPHFEKLAGVILVVSITALVVALAYSVDHTLAYVDNLDLNGIFKVLVLTASASAIGLLLKTTIAIKGMQRHASQIMDSLSKNDLDGAREKLSMIVKRNTKNLDRQHIISATLESISENIVDGITGPLFYFAFFGLAGAFAYRAVNTADSMIGYKTDLFRNLGWFGANCDKVLNFVPSRLTSMIMVLASIIVGCNWRHSAEVMKRDGPKTESPNAGYPMATMAGALGVKFEKLDHYILGDGSTEFTEKHFKTAILMMKVTSVLFAGLFTIPVIMALYYLGWWNLA
ncbi:MAG: cobalamin biosynthesis protein [Patescibacteria group bacterium]|nr:cobalamin biosynthesis protein [Nitrososphaerota archaeon]MDE2590933.1 cobalamin biosynthesis protein [Patescibacteria group bacterium]